MRYLFFYLILFTLDASAQTEIFVSGALKDIMQGGDLSAKISLDSVHLSNTTYGLGVAESLEGEIVVIAGKCFRSHVEDDKVVTHQESDTKAAMLVRTEVNDFAHDEAMQKISSIQELEERLKMQGAKLYNGKPFSFLIKSRVSKVDYHIIDWREGAEHSSSNHKQFAIHGTFVGEDVIIVGFYSDNHQGIFTPHSTNVHMHVYNPSKNVVGHVDGIMSTSMIKILLP
jgi:acetolactate decarboxylase